VDGVRKAEVGTLIENGKGAMPPFDLSASHKRACDRCEARRVRADVDVGLDPVPDEVARRGADAGPLRAGQ
jgi:hypothetical protein